MRSRRSLPTHEDGRLAIPLPTRRGAHGALVAWRSAPGRVQRARAGARRGRGRARRDRARRRTRRDARAVRARGAPPRQEQPPDGRLAAAARRERRRGSQARPARLDRPRARDRRGARPADGARATRTSTAPTSCAGCAGCCAARSTARSRRGRWRRIVLAPERATALALVLCELAANAIEHGGGHAYITLKRDGAFVELTVSDHGQGPPPPTGTPGQGLSIARALVEVDLGGTPALRAGRRRARGRALPLRALTRGDGSISVPGCECWSARTRRSSGWISASCSRAPG